MPFVITPLLGWTLGALGAAAVAKLLLRQWRRVNDELHPGEAPREAPEEIRVLRRDPRSGIYRPE